MEAGKLKNKKHSVALAYDAVSSAPRVLATGSGELAKKIISLAEEHDIPVKNDVSLMELFARLELKAEIPDRTFKAVATILAFLHHIDTKWAK